MKKPTWVEYATHMHLIGPVQALFSTTLCTLFFHTFIFIVLLLLQLGG